MSETKTPQKGSHAQGDDKLQRQASQLAYDVKYKVKQKLGKESKMSPAQVTKAYMSQLASSPAPSEVKALANNPPVHDSTTDILIFFLINSLINDFITQNNCLKP